MVVQKSFTGLRSVTHVILLLEIFDLSRYCLFLIVIFIFVWVYCLCFLIDDISVCLYQWLIIEKFLAFFNLCDRAPLTWSITHLLWFLFHAVRNLISFLTVIVSSLIQSNRNLVALIFLIYVPATNKIIISVSVVSI